jgi:hypothetical protein
VIGDDLGVAAIRCGGTRRDRTGGDPCAVMPVLWAISARGVGWRGQLEGCRLDRSASAIIRILFDRRAAGRRVVILFNRRDADRSVVILVGRRSTCRRPF